jgi:hypothetical protein
MNGIDVKLIISAYGDITTANEIELYGAAVKYLAFWFMKQDGVNGKDTEALFEEFKENVCKAMAAGAQGTG